MLEKSLKKQYFDAHFHLSFCAPADFSGCTCAHSKEEWFTQEEAKKNGKKIQLSFGIHPQQMGQLTNFELNQNLIFLEKLAQENKLNALGECGFDFFTSDFSAHQNKQEEFFINQIKIAQKFKLPVVIHCRKANEKLFEYSKELKKLPAVLFHSFMGTPIEANSLLNRGINGFFSFGKQMMNNNKKVIACVKELPLQVLLCETDAPYQTLKGESQTFCKEIEKVYDSMFFLKNISDEPLFFEQLELNYNRCFCLI